MRQVSKDGSGDWVVGGGGGGGVPPAPADLHYIVSKSTKECWDTRGPTALDLWACVPDGHNELFNYSATTGLSLSLVSVCRPALACVPVCLRARVPARLSACLPVCLPACPSHCLTVCASCRPHYHGRARCRGWQVHPRQGE